MAYTQEDILREYKALKEHLGHPPSSRRFCQETGISQKILAKLFGSDPYSKIVSQFGDTPQLFFKPKSNLEKILVQWGGLVKKLGKLPAVADWEYHKCKPTWDGIAKSHNLKWADLPYKFIDFASGNIEWKEVIDLIPTRISNDKEVGLNNKIEELTYEYYKFVPPVIQDLIPLSTDEGHARDFEIKVNLLFQLLGFEVTNYGQGTGRNPDGIAKSSQYGYAILVDAKSRKDSYQLKTEDRKFIEYIKSHAEPLRKNGYSKIYFLIVSNKFDSVSQISTNKIKLETQVSTTLITSKSLLKILSKKIEFPRLFDLKKFEELLIHDGEISNLKVDKFIAGIK
jgi:hypothetical protein